MTKVTPNHSEDISLELEDVEETELSKESQSSSDEQRVIVSSGPRADILKAGAPCTRSAGHQQQQQQTNGFGMNLFSKWWPSTNDCGKMNGKTERRPVELVWKDLCYTVTETNWSNLLKVSDSSAKVFRKKRLLNSISGSFKAGELMAIMGPSGAGKTTLIECISGRRRVGVSGDIFVRGGDKRTRLAYNAQDDSLMPCLTVWETLMFASKLRNYQRNNRLKVKLVDDNDNVYNATTYPDQDLVIR